ncbi:hypothetical protein [Microbacterium arborescens]|uniref:hypothetical protein n=1 Tax=Microbacterium arborescens TaxID=33883 RepID=UPI0027892C27|nr:hypothetical protein [Microbacterium arborescens]MDQ1217183.1 hypothetical protein [Microbacterium arborescens]
MTEEQNIDETTETEVEKTEENAKPSSEAAKYRTRLRAAEAQLAEAQSHIAELQGEVIRGLLTGVLTDPADFDQIGVAAVLGEDGRIDKAKVEDAVSQLLESKPHYAPQKARPAMRPQPRQGVPQPTAAAEKPSKLEQAFPGGQTRWSDVMHKGERAESTETANKRVRLEVSSTPGQ